MLLMHKSLSSNSNNVSQTNNVNQKGVTLIELMIVISILAVLTQMAAPYFGDMINRKNLSSGEDTLIHTLHKAKTIARAQSTRVTVTIDSNTITLDQANTADDLVITMPNSISAKSPKTIVFDSRGFRTVADGSVEPLSVEESITLENTNNDSLFTEIVISKTGLIAMAPTDE